MSTIIMNVLRCVACIPFAQRKASLKMYMASYFVAACSATTFKPAIVYFATEEDGRPLIFEY